MTVENIWTKEVLLMMRMKNKLEEYFSDLAKNVANIFHKDSIGKGKKQQSTTQDLSCSNVTTVLALNANNSVSTVRNNLSSIAIYSLARSGAVVQVDIQKTLTDMIVNVVNEKI